MKKEIAGYILLVLYAVILYALSAIVSFVVCKCFGWHWDWMVASGTMIIWLALLATIYLAMGINDDEEEK